MKLGPYLEYGDSGLPWLGQVPKHWRILPNRSIFSERIERNMVEEALLTVTIRRGVLRQSEFLAQSTKKDSSNEDKSNYKLVLPGDLAYNKMRMWQGAVGASKHRGIVSPAYIVLKPRMPMNSWYYHFLMRTRAYMGESYRHSYGICDDQLSLRYEDFKTIATPLPSRDEQDAIVAFLNSKLGFIHRLIRNKQREIALLQEQKQVIIDRAVTTGLDSGVRTKSSGIEWLGDIPEHWVIKPLKRWATINAHVLPETTDPDYEFRYIDIGSVGTGFLVRQPERMRFESAPSRARRILRKGDTIISTVRTYLRAVYFVSEENHDLVASTGFAVLTPTSGLLPEFLGLLIQSSRFIDRVMAHSFGVAYPAIPETRLGTFHMPVPPSESEQVAIAGHVRTETMAMNSAIQRAERLIKLLREFRMRLVTDVVTGKTDVRDIPVRGTEAGEAQEDGFDSEGIEQVSETEGSRYADD